MEIIEILLIAIALAMDAFTVAMSVGLHLSSNGKIDYHQYFRLSFHFGLFQSLMPVLGWLAGNTISHYIRTFDHWIAFALLSYIGIKLIRDSRQSDKLTVTDPTRGFSLILLSVATSIDALAMGLSLAILRVEIIYPSVIIGIVAAIFTICGLYLGNRIGFKWRQAIAWLGGIILIGIGLKVLIEHLWF